MPVTFSKPSKKTQNFHYNYKLKYHQLVKISNSRKGSLLTRYNLTANEIQTKLLKKCGQEGRRLTIRGSRWSLSKAPYSDQYNVVTGLLNIVVPLSPRDLHDSSTINVDDLLFVQGGTKIKSLSKTLDNRGKSLMTSGASNGQSIAGAIGTGVHGSAIDFGSTQDCIRGMHILISDTQSIYIERSSQPALNDAFAASINATVVRDDDIFNAALVSLGTFGFVYGLLLEVEDNYLLERHIIKIPGKSALDIASSLDFSNPPSGFPHPGERPFHYKLYMNPFKPKNDFIAEIMYKRPFQQINFPFKVIQSTFLGDAASIVGSIVSKFPKTAKGFAKALQGQLLPSAKEPVIKGTSADIFFDTGAKGSVFGLAIGVNISQTRIPFNHIFNLVNQQNVPGFLSVRFVKATNATIGFTRFQHTAIIEIDGVKWKGLPKFLKSVTSFLRTSNLDFTLHWGKNGDWSPDLVQRMYGSRLNTWKGIRNSVVPNSFHNIFSSQYTDTLGLT